MKAAKVIAGILSLAVVLPIWYYLLYKVLESVHASELMWFLYWVYLPTAILSSALLKLAYSTE